MFALDFNQGLKLASDAPSIPLANLQVPKLNSNSKEVCYGEDDNFLPKNSPYLPPIR